MSDDNPEDIGEASDLGSSETRSITSAPEEENMAAKSTISMPPEEASVELSSQSIPKVAASVGPSSQSIPPVAASVAPSSQSVPPVAASVAPSSRNLQPPAEIAEPEEPPPPPEPPRYIEPLGPVTEDTLAKQEFIPFILDKLFNEGSIGRLALGLGEAGKKKVGEGGSAKYEDYHWQLDKMFRQVPQDMSLGKVRLKPEELLYEGEKFVLGKLFRDLREEDGYVPTAQKEECLVDLSEAVDVNVRVIEKYCPLPVYPSPSTANMKCVQVDRGDEDNLYRSNNPQSGKVFEYSYSPVMSVAVESTDAECGSCPNDEIIDCSGRPVTPHNILPCAGIGGIPNIPIISKENSVMFPEPPPTANGNVPTASRSRCAAVVSSAPSAVNTNPVSGRCRNNLPCQSNIEAVCKAARSAMAIYDTLTGCDNFPCNIGDRPEAELENIEDSVWSWLYQVILKMVPVDSNQNPILNTIEEEPASEG